MTLPAACGEDEARRRRVPSYDSEAGAGMGPGGASGTDGNGGAGGASDAGEPGEGGAIQDAGVDSDVVDGSDAAPPDAGVDADADTPDADTPDSDVPDADLPDAPPPETCSDGLVNQNESAIDCGGVCPPCPDGSGCRTPEDCSSRRCESSMCATATCSDGVTNGTESDIDCGGSCARCPAGGSCRHPSDCEAGVCVSGTCSPPTCSDGVRNGSETGTDCGSTCGPCPTGEGCAGPEDCLSSVCTGNICRAATCDDRVENGSETDVDCGGGTCPGCAPGLGCNGVSDCASRVCTGGVCIAPSCTDGVKNGSETDIDCGGACSLRCAAGRACASDAECTTGSCFFGRCQRDGFRLRAARVFESGFGPVRAATGDMNADGHTDIIGLNRAGNSISVLLNYGNAVFAPAVQYDIPLGEEPVNAEVVDLDDDDDLDVVVRSVHGALGLSTAGTIAVFRNSGTGTLVLDAEYEVPTEAVRVADLDGDGTLDLVVADDEEGVGWLRGTGNARFAAVTWGLAGPSHHLLVGDFSGTGRMDLLVQSDRQFDDGTLLYQNQGGGVFGPARLVPDQASGLLSLGYPLGVAELDGDGHLDVLVGCQTSICGMSVLSGDGTGRFVPRLGEMVDWRYGLRNPVIEDMDGDGDNDIVMHDIESIVWDNRPEVQVWGNDGSGHFSTTKAYGSSGYVDGPWVAELDGAGGPDVIVGHGGRPIGELVYDFSAVGANFRILTNDGTGELEGTQVIQGVPSVSAVTGVTTGDLDADGDTDIAVCSIGGQDYGPSYVKVFMLEDGRIVSSTQRTLSHFVRDLAAGDFDLDGDDDIAAVGSGTLTILLSEGRGTFGLQYELELLSAYSVRSADLDGDADDDLVIGRLSRGVSTLLSQGNGSFGSPADHTVTGVSEHVALGDADGDGDLDVVATDYGEFAPWDGIDEPGNVTVLRNNGRGGLSTAFHQSMPDHPTASTFGDFDGDGTADFAVANGESHDVIVYRGQGGARFVATGPYPVLVNPSDIASSDFNGDGRTDLAVTTFSSSALSLLLNAGDEFRRFDYEAGYNPVALTVADVDRSGTPDVVVACDVGMTTLLNSTEAAFSVCAPNAPACDENTLTTCNADGTGFVGTRTACGAAQTCENGSCRDQACSPGAVACDQAGDLVQCSTDGTTSRRLDDCSGTEYCDAPGRVCAARLCTPGAPGCDGQRAGTCNADGSGLLSGSRLCIPGTERCSAGTCVPAGTCTPNVFTCIDDDVYGCQNDGSSRLLRDRCSATEHCVEGGTLCVADECPKSQPTCELDALWLCNSAGTGLGFAGRTDCVASDRICIGGACVPSETLELGGPSTSLSTRAGPYLFVNMFRVDVSRSLTDLAFRFVVPANRQVRWAVFESPTGEGSFRKKFEIERTVTAAAGLDFHSSGPIDVLLVGGYWYGLGYYVPDGHQANYTPSVGGFYSFGQAYGSLNKPFNAHSVEGDTSSFQSGAVVMRFTTAAP